MGCCASTDNLSSDPQLLRHSSVTKLNREQPPPLLPIIEEETVKEVLSETPKPKPKIPKMEDELKKMPPKEELHKIQEEEGKNFSQKKPTLMNAEEISEVSEIRSNFSLSESVSTTTVTEKRDNDDDDGDGEVLQRINRSPAKFRNRAFSADLSSRRERVVGRSPAKRSDQSRSRVKSFSGVERRGYVADGRRRESGENSGRRSRSPATCTESGVNRGRSPAMRKVGNSPGRVKPKPLGKGDEGNEEVKLKSAATGNELLENPLVSLECFIFL